MKFIEKVNVHDRSDLSKSVNALETLGAYSGKTINVKGGVVYEYDEVDETTGEIRAKRILSLKTDDGYIGTNSATAIKTFSQIVAIFSETGGIDDFKEGVNIVVKSSRGQKNREFTYLELAE